MGKKLTNEQFLQKLKDLGRDDIEPLEEYKGSGKKILCKCKVHNIEWEVRPDDLYSGQGCPKCKLEKIGVARRKTHQQFLKDMKEKGDPNVIIIGKYEKDSIKIKCKCKKCGHEWENTPSNLLQGQECPYCANKKVSIENCFATKHPELMKFLKNKEDGYNYTYGSGSRVICICLDCGTEKETSFATLHDNGFSCQVCGDSVSFPNKFIRYMILDESIQKQLKIFKFEFVMNWDIKCRLDVYFEKDNKKYAIEMQGNQHKTLKWGNKERPKIKELDEYKRTKLIEDGIIEIEIDAEESNFDYIYNNIIKSKLNDVLDLSKVDWKSILEKCYDNLIKEACDLYNNNPYFSTEDVAQKMFVNKVTIIRFLKKGMKLGWCDYKTQEHIRRSIKASKWIFELYEENGSFIIETFGARKMAEYIKDNYPDRKLDNGIISKMAKNNYLIKGFIIKRKPNPYKANRYVKNKDKN